MSTAIQPTTVRDDWIAGRRGRLFVRTWSPASPSSLAPIVLLHDSLGCVELWRDFPAALCEATGRQVIAYDRLGFGRSEAYPGALALDFVAAEAEGDFAALTRQLGLERFIVFGHSVGGGMAVHCAARFPDACVALVTESAQGFVEDRTVQGIEDARQLFKEPGAVDRLKKYHGEKAQWVLDAWVNSWLHPAFADWSLRPVLPQVQCPTLVIHGIDDEYGSSRHPEMIAALSGGPAQLELMADTRHVPHREKAGEVIWMLRQFSDGLAG
ncbi:alpha/beta fold hydrolase [Thauera sp. WH-1]|uniref:alpha/beta fold hydrolase n=1 Tax=Thauera sp. WH-1 TaxID=3398230 RepID=UPI0039FDDDBB